MISIRGNNIYINLTNDYSIGIEIIDKQHKNLSVYYKDTEFKLIRNDGKYLYIDSHLKDLDCTKLFLDGKYSVLNMGNVAEILIEASTAIANRFNLSIYDKIINGINIDGDMLIYGECCCKLTLWSDTLYMPYYTSIAIVAIINNINLEDYYRYYTINIDSQEPIKNSTNREVDIKDLPYIEAYKTICSFNNKRNNREVQDIMKIMNDITIMRHSTVDFIEDEKSLNWIANNNYTESEDGYSNEEYFNIEVTIKYDKDSKEVAMLATHRKYDEENEKWYEIGVVANMLMDIFAKSEEVKCEYNKRKDRKPSR